MSTARWYETGYSVSPPLPAFPASACSPARQRWMHGQNPHRRAAPEARWARPRGHGALPARQPRNRYRFVRSVRKNACPSGDKEGSFWSSGLSKQARISARKIGWSVDHRPPSASAPAADRCPISQRQRGYPPPWFTTIGDNPRLVLGNYGTRPYGRLGSTSAQVAGISAASAWRMSAISFHTAMNIAAITGPITIPLKPNSSIPPNVEISTT